MNHQRKKLIKQLTEYGLKYPSEIECVSKFIDLLTQRERCFYRDEFTPGHITGSAWVVDSKGERVLFTHHKKLNMWLQLGGHADGNESPLKVALKETSEESGLKAFRPLDEEIFDIDIHCIPERKGEPEHFHFDIRHVVVCTGSEDLVVSDESHDLKWIGIDTISEYTTEASIQRMTNKWNVRRTSQIH